MYYKIIKIKEEPNAINKINKRKPFYRRKIIVQRVITQFYDRNIMLEGIVKKLKLFFLL